MNSASCRESTWFQSAWMSSISLVHANDCLRLPGKPSRLLRVSPARCCLSFDQASVIEFRKPFERGSNRGHCGPPPSFRGIDVGTELALQAHQTLEHLEPPERILNI